MVIKKEAEDVRIELEREEAALKLVTGERGSKPLSAAEGAKVKADYCRLLKLYRGRRARCLEIVDMVCERANKPRRHLFQEWGLETDEDYNVSLNQFPLLN